MTDTENTISWTQDPTQHIRVACRLCGESWFFPIKYEECFKKDPSWECPTCRRQLKMFGRGPT